MLIIVSGFICIRKKCDERFCSFLYLVEWTNGLWVYHQENAYDKVVTFQTTVFFSYHFLDKEGFLVDLSQGLYFRKNTIAQEREEETNVLLFLTLGCNFSLYMGRLVMYARILYKLPSVSYSHVWRQKNFITVANSAISNSVVFKEVRHYCLPTHLKFHLKSSLFVCVLCLLFCNFKLFKLKFIKL